MNVNYEGHVQTSVTVDIDVPLKPNDIYNWLQQCEDPEILKYIRNTAAAQLDRVTHPENYRDDDDFRSRA